MASEKTALVTGANKGIGREIARRFAELDHVVWLGCRDARRGEEAAAALRKEGGDVRFLELDVADDASVTRAAAASTMRESPGRAPRRARWRSRR